MNFIEDRREKPVYTDKTDKDNPKQYRFLYNLASGRYGDVHKVELITNNDEENEENEENKQKEVELMDNIYALKSQEAFDGKIGDKLQREIDIMLKLKNNNNNNNIMLMINYFIDNDYLLFLLPFFDSNLEFLLKTAPLKMDLISNIMYQILNGLSYIHSLNIIHRDIKPNNILYCSTSSKIVIADFGSARDIESILVSNKENKNKEENKEENSKDKLNGFDNPNWNGFNDDDDENRLSPQIYVVYYRAPELLLGERNYRFGVDIWSIGCIMAQMTQKNGKLLFYEDHDIPLFMQQLQILGGPKKYELDGVGLFSVFFQIEYKEYNPMNTIIDNKNLNQSGCDLLAKMLTLGPKQRITAKQALSHPFFEKNNKLL